MNSGIQAPTNVPKKPSVVPSKTGTQPQVGNNAALTNSKTAKPPQTTLPKEDTKTALSPASPQPVSSTGKTDPKVVSPQSMPKPSGNAETKALNATISKAQDGKKLLIQTKLDAVAGKPGSERQVNITLEGQDASQVKVEQKTLTRTRVVEKENKVLWFIPWGTKKEEVKEQERQVVITQKLPDGKSFKRVTLAQDTSGKVANQQLSSTEIVKKDEKTGNEVVTQQSMNVIDKQGTTEVSRVKQQSKEEIKQDLVNAEMNRIAEARLKKGESKEALQQNLKAIQEEAQGRVSDTLVTQTQQLQQGVLNSGQNLGGMQAKLNEKATQEEIKKNLKNPNDLGEKQAMVAAFVGNTMMLNASESKRRTVAVDEELGTPTQKEFRLNENTPVVVNGHTLALNTVGYQEDGTQSFTNKPLSLEGFSATKFQEKINNPRLQDAATRAEQKLNAYMKATQADPQTASLDLTDDEKDVLFQYATLGQQGVGQSRKESSVLSTMTLEEHQKYLKDGKVDQADRKANLENYIADNTIPLLGDAQQLAFGTRRIGTFGLVEGTASFVTGKDVPFKAGASEDAPLIGADKQLENARKLRQEAISDNRGSVSWLGENLGGGLRRLTNAVQGKGFTDEFNVEEQRKRLDPVIQEMETANSAYNALAAKIPSATTPEAKQALEQELNQALTKLNTARAKLTTTTEDVKKFQEESLQNGKMVLTEAVGIGGKLITAGLTAVGGPIGFGAGLAISGALNVGTNWLLSKDTPRGYNPFSLEGAGDFFAGGISGIPIPGTGVAASGSRVVAAKTGQALLTGQGARFVLNRLSTNAAGRAVRDLGARALTRESAEALGRFVFYDVAMNTTQNMANKVASEDRADATTFFDNNGRFRADAVAQIVMDPGEWGSSFVSAVGMKGAGKALSAGKNTIVSKGFQKLAGEDFHASPAFAKGFNSRLSREVRQDILTQELPATAFQPLRQRMNLSDTDTLSFSKAWRHMTEPERLEFFKTYAQNNQAFKVSDVLPRSRPVAQGNNPVARFKRWTQEKQEAQLQLKQQQRTNAQNAAPLLEGDIFIPGGVGVKSQQAFHDGIQQYVRGLPTKTDDEMLAHARQVLPKRIRDTYGSNLSTKEQYALAEMYKGLGVSEKGAFTHLAQAQLLAGRQGKLNAEEAFAMVHHAYQLDGTLPLVPIGVRGVGGNVVGPEMKAFCQKIGGDVAPLAGVGLFEAGNPLSKAFPIIPVGTFPALFRHTAGLYSMTRNLLEGGSALGIQSGKMGMLRGAGGKVRLELEEAFTTNGLAFDQVQESLEFFAATHAMGNGKQREKLVAYAKEFMQELDRNPNAELKSFLRQKMGEPEFTGLARRTHSGGQLGSLDTPQKHQLALARYHEDVDTELLLRQRELQRLASSGKSEAQMVQEATALVTDMDTLMQEKAMLSKWHMLSMRHNMPLSFERNPQTGRLTNVTPDFNRAMQEGGGTYVYKMLNFMMGNRDMTPQVMAQLSKTTLADLVTPTEFSVRNLRSRMPFLQETNMPKDVRSVASMLLNKPSKDITLNDLEGLSLMQYYTVEALRRNQNLTGGVVNQEKYLQNIRYILNEQLTAAAKDTNLDATTLAQLRNSVDDTLRQMKPQANQHIAGAGFGLWGRVKSTATNTFRNAGDLEVPLQYRGDTYQRSKRAFNRFVPFGQGEEWRNQRTP
ncbi:MAG: hypothetical protein ACKO37_07790 [Vampirovibrionales bacterium]